MATVRVRVFYLLTGLSSEESGQLGHQIMQVALEHISLVDPYVNLARGIEKYELEFGFDCPPGGDKLEDANRYVKQIVAHACQRADIAESSFTLVSVDTPDI